jgi:hypothetical protein
MKITLTDEERAAREGGKTLIAVNHYGEDNIAGPLISVAAVLDYSAITSPIIDGVISGTFSPNTSEDLQKAVRFYSMHSVSTVTLNEMASLQIGAHLGDYTATMGCVFISFNKLKNDPDLVYSTIPIIEVLKNKDIALYTGAANKSEYVLQPDWNQFKNLIPNTELKVMPTDTFSLLFMKAFAKTLWMREIGVAERKYPGYNLRAMEIDEKEKEFLQKNGLTEYHRAFLPALQEYSFAKHILI